MVCVIRLASAGSLHAEVVCVIRLVAAGSLHAKMNACKRAWGVGMQSRVCSLSHACATGCACSCVCVQFWSGLVRDGVDLTFLL